MSIFFNINFGAGFFNNLFNGFAAGANNFADFFGVNMNGGNFRSVFGQFFARFRDAVKHNAHDVFTAAFSLCQSLFENFLVDAVNLNIHLDGGNAVFSTGNLKVHIAESVFQALNIGKNGEIIAVFYKAHCYAGNRCFNRHACVHKGKRACANAAHGGRTVGFQSLGNQADCIREFFFGRNYRQQSTFCQCAMADFAAARAAQRFGFANAVRREVIVMDITFGKFYAKSVQSLCFAERSQCQYV